MLLVYKQVVPFFGRPHRKEKTTLVKVWLGNLTSIYNIYNLHIYILINMFEGARIALLHVEQWLP